ncbi:hypothetical protein Tel_14860 [Candidatus Tenderia electrophaga]|jgi:hypothetical protein|uniref:Probable membrane transporter protein n=1 Tax=Candidatus Tenderia electrophaga TaxID=1748243 RepID=A0A0S2TGR0_9GAMM|nr:hypothetical protein Tel_14860 [Candidatus Tenderia electrophaga]
MEWGYTIAGFLVGLLVGLTGVGGGSLMTPLLIFAFHVNPAIAVGTDLLFAAATKAGGIWSHSRKRQIDWHIVALMALGSLPTALLSLWLVKGLLDQNGHLDALITITLGVALILTAAAIVLRRQMHRCAARVKRRFPRWHRQRPYATVAGGVLLGLLVPITSVGAGALGAAMLMFLYPSLPTKRIVGTDIAHAVPLTLLAGLGHLHLGTVDPGLLLVLLLGSLPGIYLGSHLSSVFPERIMRPLLATLLLLIGMKFVLH